MALIAKKIRQDTNESWASSNAVRQSMTSNRGRDTIPELAVRSAAHRLGLRFRVNARPISELRRTADLVFSRQRVAVFVDGCFWHGCPIHYTAPAAHSDYWADKLAANTARDRETDEKLRAAGWTVIRCWEHDEPSAVAAEVERIVRSLRDP